MQYEGPNYRPSKDLTKISGERTEHLINTLVDEGNEGLLTERTKMSKCTSLSMYLF